MAYPLGTGVTLEATFNDATAGVADPTAVTLFVRKPKQVTPTQYTGSDLTHPSKGVYSYELYLDTAGTWTYCWEGTGLLEAATFDIPLVVEKSALRTT